MPFLLPAAATAVAAAAPAAAAAATTAAATAGITATLTSVATNILMNVAISAVMSALSPQVGAAGRTFEWTLDPDGPIPFAAGRIGVAGSAVYRETFGPDLMYYGIPSVISGAGPIDGFESFLADDESVTFDGTGKAVSSQYAGELWYKTSLGAQPATAITSPSGLKSGAALPGWTSAHKLSGKASYVIVMGENSKGTAFPTGEIKPLVTLRGLKGWDPRQDSTYSGGSGACRLNDPSTWVYLANPILWALKWSLGLWEGPTGKGAPQVDYQVGGIGAKLSGIDVPAFVAAANVADANGWTVAAYPTTDDDKAQVLDAFLQAGGATYAQRAGKISCIQRAAPRTSIVTISGRDTAGPLEIDTAASRIDRINTIRPRYWSEAHRWQLTALPEVTASAYQTQDGGKRTRGIDYPYVTDPVQAAQLAALQIANTREGIAGLIPLKPHLQRIRPGDAFTITEEDFVLNGVKCLCLNTDYDPATGIVRVSFVSETDAKYPFALGQSPDAPVPPVLTPVDNRYVGGPLPGDWVVTPRPPATGGTQLPGFDLTGLVSNATATAILVEYGPSATGPWKQAYQGPPTVTNVPIDGVQPGAIYYIAVSYQRGQNFSQRDVYGPYTAPGLVAGDVLPSSPTIAALQDVIEQAQAELEAAQEVADDQIEALNATVYTAVTGLKAQTESLFSDVNAATTGLKAKTDALLSTLNTPATGLIARVASAETQITENNTATVESLRVLDARARTVPNLISGGDFSGDLTGLWSVNDASTVIPAYYDGRVGSHALINAPTNFLASKTYPVSAGAVLSLSFDGQASTPGAIGAYVQWLPSYNVGAQIAGIPANANNWETRKRSPSDPAPAPAGTTGFRVVLARNGSSEFYVSRVKVNTGGEAADWSDDATISDSRARLTSLDSVVTTPTTGLVSRMALLESTIDTPGTGVAARLTTLNNIVTTPTTGLVAKTAVLESTVNTPVTGVSARLGTLEQVITTPTTGLAAKVTALETAINTPLTGLSARIGSSELAIADLNLNKASAERVSFLEAYSRSVVNSVINSDFSQGGYKWSGGAAWGYNTAGGDLGPYAVTYVAGQQFLLSDFFPLFGDTDYGFSVLGDGGSVPAQAGIYVAEFADNGSGAPGALLRDSLAPVSMVGATWNKPVHSAGFTSGPTARWGRVALYKNGGTSSAAFSKIMFHRGKAPVAWNDNQTDLNALSRLSLAETAITSNNTAAASRLFLLETSVNTAGTGLSARMGSAESAISDLNTGKASAERVAFLEARTRTAPNLIPNSTANGGAKGWNVLNSPFIAADPTAADGGRFIMPTGGSGIYAALQTDFFPVYGNSRYSFQGEIYAQGLTAGDVRAYVSYYNAAGGVVLYQVFLTNVDRGWYPFKLENLEVPASAVKANCTIDVLNATVTVAAWRRLKLENGPICTFWSDDATDIMTSARLTTAETAITTNNTAAVGRLQILEAAVTTPLTGLSAKVASHDNAIADLNTGKASASSVSLLEVRSQTLPNLISNPQFSNGFDNWYVDGVNGASIQTDAQVGRYVNITGAYIASDPPKPAFAGMQVSFSFDGDDGGAADAAVYVQWLPSYASGAFLSNFGRSWTNRKFCNGDTGAVAPAGTTGFRIVAARGASSAFNIARIKCNYGPKATAWSNEAEANDVYARITDTSTVALDAQGKANASRTLVLDVNNYVSGTQSINNGVISAFNVLADKFSVVAPGGGDRTEYLAAYGCWFVHSPLTATRTRYGRAFNSSQMIVWWTGPDSVPIGSETKANAYVYISQNETGGRRFGGSDTGVGPTFTASVPNVRVKTQVGGSTTVTTAAVAITTAGATGGITYTWTNTFGDPSMVANYSDGSSVTFSSTIPGVGRVQTIWTWTAYDSGTGISRSGQVFVTIQRDA